ncbi:arsenate reductase [Streptococcus dysgalactiae subsp. dysgalactiae]|uniref:Arsenate reductase n=1 Tax=Streptococcus dysgalactiae subsp. dysgalactiae TaxID=99822 RepID=A0A380JU87_STRDY|nr:MULTISPECIES: hypothetical protein [Streptococcus]EFY02724.1 hypothetical protein SDD27957_05385 [Streptococcus dysgalactiae subsp. dysgalactiae ATCC 27957]MCB2835624.1 hypothetical protein [Streptococcus dysgalactiae subsp. dysgalactiae]SUN49138.1 arsenate reductase [Streptococcus dysgalactiae subsp. dysgalactiae]HEO0884314.1 hypothetical protein [Streptococcus agalactiae]HEO4332706.1 hypothetical protein [Streptococcus agalactiae]
MLEIYLSRNKRRNQRLLSFCDSHGISYTIKTVSEISREEILGLFAQSSDCFELLAPSLQRFKRHDKMKLSELVALIVRKPEQYLRLPIIVDHQKLYPVVSLEEARTFLPRNHKVVSFREHLFRKSKR